jgi:hypothetical protein
MRRVTQADRDRWEQERVAREAATAERWRQYNEDHPVREDLYPLAERLYRARAELSRLHLHEHLHEHLHGPGTGGALLRAMHERAEREALDELEIAAAASPTPGVRIPMVMPDRGFYLSITDTDTKE